MAFSISPGVSVSEVDLTTVVPSVLTTAGAFAGAFNWGPANTRVQITSESNLFDTFKEPTNNTFISYYTAASFLAYGNNLRVVRALGANSFNADSNTTTANIQVANKDQFDFTLLNNTVNANTYGPFMARYAGELGNSLTVSVVDSASYSTSWTVNGVGVSSYFGSAPSTSAQATAAGGTNDQLHVVVVHWLKSYVHVY